MSDTSKLPSLSVEDACARLSISRRTLYRMFRDGQLSHWKIGGQVRILEAEVVKLMDELNQQCGDCLTYAELGPLLKVSRRTLQRLVSEGQLDAHTGPDRKTKRFSPEAIETYLRQHWST